MEIRLLRDGREVISFAVQYLAEIQGRWHAIVRFDTAHTKPHMDTLWPDGRKETLDLHDLDKNRAFTYAISDIKSHWEFYRVRYQRAMSQ